MTTQRFAGKVAIITGSSSGIGQATAVQLSRDGAKVTITGRNSEKLEETKKIIVSSGGNPENIIIVVGDITDANIMKMIVDSTIQKFGRLDILINNAGAAFMDPDGIIGSQVNMDVFEKTFQLNLKAVVQLIQLCRSHLIASKGEIVNVSSIAAGPQVFPFYTFYGMAKAALDQLTRCLALEMIQYGVRVNSVSPGLIQTGFLNALGMENGDVAKAQTFFGEHRDCIPIGFVGTAEHVATLITFLADRNSSHFIIGQSIVVDGGTSLVVGMAAHEMKDVLG